MDLRKGQALPRQKQEAEHKERRTGKAWTVTAAKLLLVPFLLFFSLVIGLVIGYSVIGNKPVSEVFDFHTYKHMYDLIFQDT
jgi:hypothetical protein